MSKRNINALIEKRYQQHVAAARKRNGGKSLTPIEQSKLRQFAELDVLGTDRTSLADYDKEQAEKRRHEQVVSDLKRDEAREVFEARRLLELFPDDPL